MTRHAAAMLSAVLTLSAIGASAPAARAQSGGTASPEEARERDRSDDRDRERRRSSRADPGDTTGGGSATGESPASPGGSSTTSGLSLGSGSLRVAPGALLGRPQRVLGTLGRAGAGLTVMLQLGSPRAGWQSVATGRADASGEFALLWRPERTGRFTIRALPARGRRAGSAASGAPSAGVTVYAPATATLFGPGLFGGPTACGGRLAPDTVGIAHRSLPCGTRVEVYYGGRRMVVPVIDRGPFVAGVTWDLTSRVAQALGFSGRGLVGTIPGPAT